VNPYSQEFFRARPGYSAANEPRVFDPSDPYAREFYHAGYFGSFRGSGGWQESSTKIDGLIDKLTSLVGQNGWKIEGPPVNINLNVADGLEVDRQLGPAPRPETFDPTGGRGTRTFGSDF
jgi:hypothetical protein